MFKNLIVKDYASLFKKIKNGSRIAIWGTLIQARLIKNELEANRKDVSINFFIDSHRTGVIDGIEIITPEKLKENAKLVDIVIITSYHSGRQIACILDEYIKLPYIFPSENFLTRYVLQQSRKKIEKMLHSKEDKYTFNIVLDDRLKGRFENIIKHIDQKNRFDYECDQYLENIDKDVIKTMIEGGVNDAHISLTFKYEFKNLTKLYGFEPMYEKFKNGLYDKFLNDSDWFKIFELGLWDKKETLKFIENGHGSRISPENDAENCISIKTISLDEFVDAHNIGKIDCIKLDIEGAEMKALKGGIKTIIKNRPQMVICLYHSIDDIIEIPLYLKKHLTNYIYKIEHYTRSYVGTMLYAIPKELYKNEN